MIIYEFPLHERIRTLLRLDSLLEKFEFYLQRDTANDHHVALLNLFDIISITGRSDLKLDLSQELEKQHNKLQLFSTQPNVDELALSKILQENQQVRKALLSSQGKPGQSLRDNEWLKSLKNRMSLPGGVCEFDVPSYHYWLSLPVDQRQEDLFAWQAPLVPLRDALRSLLAILRKSSQPESLVAKQGKYQKMLAGRTSLMIRLQIQKHQPCIPEISANKYAMNIRFVNPSTSNRPGVYDSDVKFALTYCDL